MSVVYRARDDLTGKTVALKQMRLPENCNADQRLQLATLFEHEYYTLSELSHPRIVEVFEYGTTDEAPYYTMELLDGHDLREGSLAPWREACAVLRDVCSALALLHSRRLVHRDLTPRNVRRTSDGSSKLFDFGAMTAFGTCRHVVGTPSYTAPESLRGQPLDGRTDLFALGALAYWLLTGRAAYPARTLHELESVWRRAPLPPSAYVSDVPDALDRLIMALLALDPLARPGSAAEVTSRLTAIAELPVQSELEVAQAYLTTPRLVGRERHQAEFRDRLAAAERGEGSALLVSAPGGRGRSRLLASYVLEAKLSGSTVLHVNASQLHERELGVLHALLEELQALAPRAFEQTEAAAIARFMRVSPGSARRSLPPPDGSKRPAGDDAALVRAQAARFLCDAASDAPLAIVVDDVHRADPGSTVVLVELAQLAPRHPIVLVASCNTDVTASSLQALAALRDQCDVVMLEPLSEVEIDQLLESVFGDIPNLDAVAEFVKRVAGGSPRTCMELAQHLVDRKIARFTGDGWELPGDLASLELPASIEQVLDDRIAALAPRARALAELLALATRHLPLLVPDYVKLLASEFDPHDVFAAVDELVSANVLAPSAFGYAFEHAQLVAAVQRAMSEARKAALHRALASHFATRYPQWPFVSALHAWRAGDLQRAIELVMTYVPSQELSTPNIGVARSPDGTALFDALLDHLEHNNFDKLTMHKIGAVALKLGAVADPRLARGAKQIIAQLAHDSGRIYFDDTDPTLELPHRVKACFDRALAVHQAAPEGQRGLPPLAAIQDLAVCVSTLTAVCGRTRDAELAATLPSLIEPFRVFKAIQVVHDIATMVSNSIGRGQYVLEQRKRTLAALEQPVPGIDEITRLAARMIITYYAGLDEALRCDPAALDRAAELDKHPHYAALAAEVRVLYHANTGDARELWRARKRRALLSMTTSETDHHLVVGTAYELPVLARTEDLMGLNALLPRLRKDAEQYPGWRPYLCFAEAAQRALHGKHDKARERFERGLALLEPGKHAAWAPLVEGYIHALLAQHEYARAHETALRVERTLRELDLALFEPTHMAIALALAAAFEGQVERARERIALHIEQIESRPQRGLIRGALYEARARIALLEGDDATYAQYLERTADEYRPGEHPGLLARYERLRAAGRKLRSSRPVPGSASGATFMTPEGTASLALLRTRLERCTSGEERARAALALAAELSGAESAYLYACDARRVALAASHGPGDDDLALAESLALKVKALAHEPMRDDEEDTRLLAEAEPTGSTSGMHETKHGRRYFLFALRDPLEPSGISGALVLSAVNGRMPDLPPSFLWALSGALHGNMQSSSLST